MKLKKFFAGVLAAAMMLTVGATAAFATEPAGGTDEAATSVKTTIKFDEKLTKDSEIPLYKTYNVVNGVSPAEAFRFTVKYVKTLKQDTKNWAPSCAKDEVVIEDIATDEFPSMTTGQTASKFFKITPAQLGLSNPEGTGKYLYEITEKAGSTAATNYQKTSVYMAVTVAHAVDGDNVIDTNSWVYYVTMFSSQEAAEGAKNNEAVTGKINNTNAFTNTYGDGTVHKVTLSKTVNGGFGDLNKTFYFTVRFNSVNYVNYGVITATKSADSIVIKKGTEAVQPTKPNGNVYNLDYDTDYTIEMKHGENVVFDNLPAGITYTMTENRKTDGKVDGIYNVENEVTDKEMENADATVAIINTNPESPDMGVVLDNAPYIALLAIVAIGGVALMLNKRRRDEE